MISVVIPLYNKVKSIASTLQSVCEQTYTDYEVVIVNDGSTDESLDVVNEFVKRIDDSWIDDRLTIISQPNSGVSAARNAGVRAAKGEYVAFLDGDDLWEPTYLEEAVKLINNFPGAAIYGLGLGSMMNGEKHPAAEFVPAGYRGIVRNLWDNPNTMLAWTSSSSICPRELLMKNPANTKLTHGEDLDQWLRLMLQGEAVFYNKTLAYYVKDAENRAMYRMPPIERHVVSVIGDYADARKRNPQFKRAFDTQMIYFLYPYLFTSYKKEALRLAERLDYTQLKKTLQFRMKFPHIYRMYERAKELGTKEI